MSLKYLWVATFTLHNVSISDNVRFDGFSVESHPESSEKAPKVLVTYRFATEDYDPNVYRETKEKIERFLDITSFNSALQGTDLRQIMTDFDMSLDNWIELHQAGKFVPSKGTHTFHNTGKWTQHFAEIELDWAERLGKGHNSDVLFRIMRLLRLSIWESDEYDRFSMVWKSFNAFYNHVYGSRKHSELARIHFFADKLLATNSKWLKAVVEEYWTPFPKPTPLGNYLTWVLVMVRGSQNVLDDLSKQNLTMKGINYSKRVLEAIKTSSLQEALQSALSCIYVERCRVEHGEIYSEEERDLLYICATILQRIIAVGLNEYYFIPAKIKS
jgi:hypothetical protein